MPDIDEEPIPTAVAIHHPDLPTPEKMAEFVAACLNANPRLRSLNEPYRGAMSWLGYGDWDGTPWWDAVMEAIG